MYNLPEADKRSIVIMLNILFDTITKAHKASFEYIKKTDTLLESYPGTHLKMGLPRAICPIKLTEFPFSFQTAFI